MGFLLSVLRGDDEAGVEPALPRVKRSLVDVTGELPRAGVDGVDENRNGSGLSATGVLLLMSEMRPSASRGVMVCPRRWPRNDATVSRFFCGDDESGSRYDGEAALVLAWLLGGGGGTDSVCAI